MTRALVAMLVLVLTSWPGQGSAGDEVLAITLVNMTPGPVSESSRQCSATIVREMRRAGQLSPFGITLHRLGETAARRALGEGDFLGWEWSAFEPLRTEETRTFILFDCRPEDRVFRALIVPRNQGSAVRTELRGVSIEPLYEWIVADLLEYSWW